MKMPILSLTRLVLSTVAGIGVVSLLLPQPSWADPNNEANPLKDFETQRNNDPFSSSRDDADGFGVFDLIHRATLGNNRSLQDYSTEQNENLDAAAAQFRSRQRERIQGQDQPTPVNPVTTPELSN